MLSPQAANALLKTLEEPPCHVIFVLATTDPQKVMPTIRSRTQHYEFRLLGAETLAELVGDVNTAAGLDLDAEALSVAVRRGRGSARDTLSALDQVAASGSAEGVRPELAEIVDSIAEDDPGRALVAVAALSEAGWGPQLLATELVEELRQAFLTAMAPELAGVEGDDLERLGGQADRLGLPRLVRSIEVLGRAQVDMREAPDARVLLEVALVRMADPSLDDTPAGLLDRITRLEQARSESASAAPSRPPAPRALAPTGPVTDPRAQPTIGALRRQRAEAKGEAPPGPTQEPPVDSPTPAPSSEPVAEPPREASAASAGPPDRDALVQAWGDHILRSLPARAKALFSGGRFVSAQGQTATFALPNAAHRDRCEDCRGIVEEAVSSYFGTPVTFELVVDGTTAGGGTEAPAAVEELAAGDDFDPSTAEEVGTVESMAEARLLEAFPGAEEVSG
jgi:DNA polymerase III subunit gamma/tau